MESTNYFLVPSESGLDATEPPEMIQAEYPSKEVANWDSGRKPVAGIYTMGKEVIEARLDYPVVGYREAWAGCVESLTSFGKHSDDIVTAVKVGDDFISTYDDDTIIALGVCFSWSTERQTSQPFNLTLKLTNWENAGAGLSVNSAGTANPSTSVDRTATLYICQGVNGGRIYVPFAQRGTPSMLIAMPVIGRGKKQVSEQPIATASITNVPANLAASFNLTTQLMTAHSLTLAQFARRAGLYTQIAQAPKVCGV